MEQCFKAHSESFEDTVLKVVNLGGDTDTAGCVTGALARLCYGEAAVLESWKQALASNKQLRMILDEFAKLVPVGRYCLDK